MSKNVYYLKQNANEIIPNLWLGDRFACPHARALGFSTICVIEDRCDTPKCIYKRIMPFSATMMDGSLAVRVDDNFFNEAIETVNYYHSRGPTLIHCGAGIERSPLTVAMYLVKYSGLTIDEAYKFLKEKRHQVEDRRHWLNLLRR